MRKIGYQLTGVLLALTLTVGLLPTVVWAESPDGAENHYVLSGSGNQTGTTASITQVPLRGSVSGSSHGAVAHNDFDPVTGSNMLDAYVENTGETELFVRMKLTESFSSTLPSYATGWYYGSSSHVLTLHDLSDSFHRDTVKLTTGGSKQYLKAGSSLYGTYTYGSTLYIDNNVAHDNRGVGLTATGTDVGTTLDAQAPISMTAYQAMSTAEKNAYVGWIFDNSDANGWFYWSRKLAAGDATGLLLHGATLKDSEYAASYSVEMDFEVVDETDIDLWLGTSTTPQEPEDGAVWSNEPASYNAVSLLSQLGSQKAADRLPAMPHTATVSAPKQNSFSTIWRRLLSVFLGK